MKIEAEVKGEHLEVQVIVANESKEALYLMNWMFDWFGQLGIPEMHATRNRPNAKPTRELAYACLGSHGELVLLNGDGPSPPSNISVFAPRLPYGTRLPAGETYRGTIRLSLPVREWHPYASPRTAPTQQVRTHVIRYKLEILLESVCNAPVLEHEHFPGVYKATGYPHEVREAKTMLQRPLTVLQRTDEFERFG